MGVDHRQRLPALGMVVGRGEIGLHDEPAALLYQGVADEAEHRVGAGRLLVEPRVGTSRRGMGRVRPLLAPEVDFGIVELAVGADSEGVCSAWPSAGLSGPDGPPGSSSGGVSAAFG